MEASDIGVTIDDVRALASTLERSYEAVVRDRVKFRVGRIVYLAFSRDDSLMGFAFPKEEREALVATESVACEITNVGGHDSTTAACPREPYQRRIGKIHLATLIVVLE